MEDSQALAEPSTTVASVDIDVAAADTDTGSVGSAGRRRYFRLSVVVEAPLFVHGYLVVHVCCRLCRRK